MLHSLVHYIDRIEEVSAILRSRVPKMSFISRSKDDIFLETLGLDSISCIQIVQDHIRCLHLNLDAVSVSAQVRIP